jgi:hypothetical protein
MGTNPFLCEVGTDGMYAVKCLPVDPTSSLQKPLYKFVHINLLKPSGNFTYQQV